MTHLNTSGPTVLFQRARNSAIYVDKSGMIPEVTRRLNTMNQYVCVTRPRRFGKSINAQMLAAYYTKGQDTKALFHDLAVAADPTCAAHQNAHNVFFLDMSRIPSNCVSFRDYLTYLTNNLSADILEAYPQLRERNPNDIPAMLNAVGDRFLFILDEWDAIFYRDFMTEADKLSYLEFLKLLLKDQPYVELAYLTGVLPIARYSSGSALNMFEEFSFLNDNIFDRYFGFTEDEVNFLCQRQQTVPYEEICRWYDGYVTATGLRLFNPRSVNLALTRGVCLNYWTDTGPMNEVAACIEHNVDAVREDVVRLVAQAPVFAKLNGYSASDLRLDTRDEILSAMVVYGFLSYHNDTLRIPNHELMEKFQAVLSRQSLGAVKAIVDRSREMLNATLLKDAEKVAEILENTHDREIPFLQYNDENALSCVITLCYLAARDFYEVKREAKSGKGYCDYLFLPKKGQNTAIILELKVDGTCEAAIQQIKAKNYIQQAAGCERVLYVGINYDKKSKTHQCIIEEAAPGTH